MENFFSTLKTELVYRKSWRSREEAENELFAYIDAWHNTQRIQARLGWLSPDEYETAWRDRQAFLDDQPATPADRRPSRHPPSSKHSELPGEPHNVTGRTTGWKAALNVLVLFYGERITPN